MSPASGKIRDEMSLRAYLLKERNWHTPRHEPCRHDATTTAPGLRDPGRNAGASFGNLLDPEGRDRGCRVGGVPT